MCAITFRPEPTARGWFTPSDTGPEGERRSRQFRAEFAVDGPWLNDDRHPADIDRVDKAPDEFEVRYHESALSELAEFEAQACEDKTAAAAYPTGL